MASKRGIIAGLAAVALLAGAGAWVLTEPSVVADAAVPQSGNAERGRLVFAAAGCGSCHRQTGQEDPLLLGGGLELQTGFGTFRVPNISSDPDAGIGRWSAKDFANALWHGVSPAGEHYYPAFPYAAYQNMTGEDVGDLFAYIRTLPASPNEVADHELDFPYGIRRGVGLWKALYLDQQRHQVDPAQSPEWNRGAYLVEALAHCGECHTPRDALGGLDPSRRLAGAPIPGGDGRNPNITPSDDGIGDWSAQDIAFSLADGTTPDGDVFGGDMAHVVDNLAELPQADRDAIAVYLKSVPPLPDSPR